MPSLFDKETTIRRTEKHGGEFWSQVKGDISVRS
jgi:hypothetical protein